MDVLPLQTSLNGAGFDLAADGVAGPDTYQALTAEIGMNVPGLGAALAAKFPGSAINAPLRVIHFLAQAAHETDGFKVFVAPGSARHFARFDGRADLGNSEHGDGYRFRGRGIFRLTGRASYIAYGARLDLDLVKHPYLAGQPAVAAAVACLYWNYYGLNVLADADDCTAITRKITGGLSGLASRQAYLAKIKSLWRWSDADRVALGG